METTGCATGIPRFAVSTKVTMTFLSLRNVSRTFGSTTAVSDVSLDVDQGEFFGLLGPSGCGKTTTLRMIAGLEKPDGGRIEFQGADITALPPEQRGFGMVFQNYALFPHLNVFENVAFGLRARQQSKEAIAQRVESALELVQLAGYAKRGVDELSGGQQQRVAIARAIAIEPALLLFDEPLSNLDVSLREDTRRELRELVKRLGLTAVYVTHDQEEAFALCDRISVMVGGKLMQTGRPRELYEQPADISVAGFLGRNNLIRAMRLSSSKTNEGEFKTLEGGHTLRLPVNHDELSPLNKPVYLSIRPEHVQISLDQNRDAVNALRGTIREIVFAGATSTVRVDAAGLLIEALVLHGDGLSLNHGCTLILPPDHIKLLK